jgi:Rieske 2Fe-2S family protein
MSDGTLTSAGLTQMLMAQYQPGYSLPRPFYQEPELYQLELEQIWRRGWLFAGYTCQIPQPGDFFVYEIDTDSIVIVRQADQSIAAFHNLCRHRGSLIVAELAGRCQSFVCPYHQWSYALDGSLQHTRSMPADFSRLDWSLKPIAIRNLSGAIYICLSRQPPDFVPARQVMEPMMRPQGFEQAQIAEIIDYDIHANWKLVWENNRECYHCDVNHPQYVKANFDRYDQDTLNLNIAQQLRAATQRLETELCRQGLSSADSHAGLFRFPDAERNLWYAANRTALVAGYVSESLDGRQVAPLMGSYSQPDVGTLRLRTLPNFWNHSSCDHAVSTRLTPAGIHLTRARVIWLVSDSAKAGQDFDLDTLLPFWQLTSEQDWQICERQQRGINSSAYQPGPLSPLQEANVDQFIRWYLRQLVAEANLDV